MPLAVDPQARFRIVLQSDRDAEPEPAFLCKYLSAALWRRVGRVQDRIEDLDGADEVVDLVFDAIKLGIVGWENMLDYDEFDADKLEEVLTIMEAQELLQKIMIQGMDVEVKKKSESPLPSSTEESARTAPGATSASGPGMGTEQSACDAPSATGEGATPAADEAK